MTAYYNEIDPFAAAWLRELIAAGEIAPGEVDERSIEVVQPEDLKGFIQCHFFAGIGVWSYALRRAGWPDDRPVRTASCPCPPFSSAGKKSPCPRCGGSNPVPHVGRSGYFVCCACDHEWFADLRHLYPELFRLVSVSDVVPLFGEQVASADGRTWLALVRASLEILGYAVGCADTSSALVGAPHIRQRLYFVAEPPGVRCLQRELRHGEGEAGSAARIDEDGRTAVVGVSGTAGDRTTRDMVDTNRRGRSTWGSAGATVGQRSPAESAGGLGVLGFAGFAGLEGHAGNVNSRDESGRLGENETRPAPASSVSGAMADASSGRCDPGSERRAPETPAGEGQRELGTDDGRELGDTESGGRGIVGDAPRSWSGGHVDGANLLGFWGGADWIACADGKARPVEPGSFPLAHGAPARVGRLRGYGNAINAEQAKAFIEAYLDVRGDG